MSRRFLILSISAFLFVFSSVSLIAQEAAVVKPVAKEAAVTESKPAVENKDDSDAKKDEKTDEKKAEEKKDEKPVAKPVKKTQAQLQREKLAQEEADRKKAQEDYKKDVERRNSQVNGKLLLGPDRTVARRLEQTEQLIERKRYSESVQMLGTLLESSPDCFLEDESNRENTTTLLTLKSKIEQIIKSLPPEAKQLYAIQYGNQAKRLLQDAVQSGSIEKIEKIVSNYFYTESGSDAAFILAMTQYDQGAPGSALLTFRRIAAESSNIDIYEPAFSLTLSACELRLGLKEDAKKTLESFIVRHPNPKLRVGGEEVWTPQNADEMLERIASWNVKPNVSQWLMSAGWLSAGGTPWQNASIDASAPLLELSWKTSTTTDAKWAMYVSMCERQIASGTDPYPPASTPLLVKDAVIIRGNEGISAVNYKSGKRLWASSEAAFDIPAKANGILVVQPQTSTMNVLHQNPQFTIAFTRFMFWHNRTEGAITSNGEAVFSIEGSKSMPMNQGYSQKIFVQIPNEQGLNIDDPRELPSNTLIARSVANGKIIWKSGKHQLAQKQLDQLVEQYVDDKDRSKKTKPKKANQGGIGEPTPPIPANVPFGNNIPGPPVILLNMDIEADRENPGDDEPQFCALQADEIKEIDFEDEKPAVEEITPETPDQPAGRPDDKVKPPKNKEEEITPFVSKIPISPEEQFFGETFFLGPPLPLQDRLYVLGESGGAIRLLIMDAKTGHLIRHQGLIAPKTPIQDDFIRQLAGATPAFSDGIVVCPTAAGAVAAVDATTGNPIWCMTYTKEKEDPNVDQNMMRMMRFNMMNNMFLQNGATNEGIKSIFGASGWLVPSTTIIDGKVVFAPSDSPFIFCIDLISGKLLWERPRGTGLYVACVHDGKVVIVAPDSVTAISLANGQAIWDDKPLTTVVKVQPLNNPYYGGAVRIAGGGRIIRAGNNGLDPFGGDDPNSGGTGKKGGVKTGDDPNSEPLVKVTFPDGFRPNGTGVYSEGRYFLPMTEGKIAVVDLNEGKIDKSWQSYKRGQLGNLIAIRGRVFSQTATEVDSFDQIESLRSWAEGELRKNPNSPEALFELGRIAFAFGDYAVAIDHLKRSTESKRSPQGISLLKDVLSEALQSDFVKWRGEYDYLYRLAESPQDQGGAMRLYADGCLKLNENETFFELFEKLLKLDQENRILLEGSRNQNFAQVRLARWISDKVRELSGDPDTKNRLEQIASAEYERILALADDEAKTPEILNGSNVLETFIERKWKAYLDHFSSLEISDRIRDRLLDSYERRGAIAQMELLVNSNLSWDEFGKNPLEKNEVIIPTAVPSEPETSLDDFFGDPKTKKPAAVKPAAPAPAVESQPKPPKEEEKKPEKDSPNELGNIFDEARSVRLPDLAPLANAPAFAPSNVLMQDVEMPLSVVPPSGGYRPQGEAADEAKPEIAAVPIGDAAPPENGDPEAAKRSSRIASEILRLARALEKAGKTADSFMYYQLLAKTWGNVGISLAIDGKETTKTGSEWFEDAKGRDEFKIHLKGIHWPEGRVVFNKTKKLPELKGPADRNDSSDNAKFNTMLHNRQKIFYFGTYSPFLTKYDFAMEIKNQNSFFVCCDESGKELWRLKQEMPKGGMGGQQVHYYNNYGFSQTQDYVKGANHVLYLVRSQTITAIDVLQLDSSGVPKVLWKKNLPTPLLPMRYSGAAMQIYNYVQGNMMFRGGGGMAVNTNAPSDPVFVGPNIVCYQDIDMILGLDPLTGETLWSRQSTSPRVSFAGDNNYVFAIDQNGTEAVVLDVVDGKELGSAVLPPNIVHMNGNAIVSVGMMQNQGNYQLRVYDLRDILKLGDKKQQALAKKPNANEQTYTNGMSMSNNSLLKPKYAENSLGQDTMIRIALGGRAVGILKSTRSFYLVDLDSIEDVFKRTCKAPPYQRGVQQTCQDFEVAKIDDQYLILFVNNQDFQNNVRRGIVQNRSPLQLGNTPLRQVGAGSLMLYDSGGKPLWNAAFPVKSCSLVSEMADSFPVVVFGAQIQENASGQSRTFPAFIGVDKKTGKLRFSVQIGRDYGTDKRNNMSQINGMYITAEPENDQLLFHSQQVTFAARFTDLPIPEKLNIPSTDSKTSKPPVNKLASLQTIAAAIPKSIVLDVASQQPGEDFKNELSTSIIDGFSRNHPEFKHVINAAFEKKTIENGW